MINKIANRIKKIEKLVNSDSIQIVNTFLTEIVKDLDQRIDFLNEKWEEFLKNEQKKLNNNSIKFQNI